MVQSLGISVGNANSYVAAGLGGGIEILLNEYSNRATPSMVAFADEVRAIGVDASSNFFMNLKNTIYDVMVMVGKSYKQLIEERGENSYPFKLEEAPNGQALVVVRHLGIERKFTLTQVLAMLFTKLKGVANNAADCVISYPQFFQATQKAAIIHAAKIAGLNPLSAISEMSAVVLNYAYYRTTSKDSHKFIMFVNFGQSNLQTALAWLNPKEDLVRILAAESEHVGGKDFDKVLVDHFVRQHNLKLTQKAYMKMLAACEKLKKGLSANASATINVESLISEEEDFTSKIEKTVFEELIKDLLARVESCLRRTLEVAKANFDCTMAELMEIRFQLEAVEVVGGSTRVPAVKQLIQDVFALPPSTTLNTDEAVTRGCVLHCATLHPGMKVKREVRIMNLTNSESFYKFDNIQCDKDARRVELELITCDAKYHARTDARNTLEEYIYSERSKHQDGSERLVELNTCLDWFFSDEGMDASEEEYKYKLSDLKKKVEVVKPVEITMETEESDVNGGDAIPNSNDVPVE